MERNVQNAKTETFYISDTLLVQNLAFHVRDRTVLNTSTCL